jgi:hypothetical protein
MNHLRALTAALPVLAVAAVLGACSPSAPAASRVSDPRQVVVEALKSTAALEAAHALVRVDILDGSGRHFAANAEGDVNVASRELDVSATFDPPVFGTRSARVVVTGGFVFSNTSGSWSASGGPGRDPLQGVPTTAQAAATIAAAIQDPATSVTLAGTEACAEATCLRIRADIPADVAWRALNSLAAASGGRTGSLAPPPSGFPGLGIDLWIEQDTLRLRQASNVTKVGNQSVSITIVLSHHGEAVRIEPPVRP